MCSYCLLNPCSFCKIHCSLSSAVLPCALVKYLVNRMAYEYSMVSCSTLLETFEAFKKFLKKTRNKQGLWVQPGWLTGLL